MPGRSYHIVVDLLYGDQGKGTTVDFLARKFGAKLAVRFNGGPQALHNVVTAAGFRHGFAQFGSATFAGARTYLSRHMLVELTSLVNEAKCLEQEGMDDPMFRVTVDADCVLITPMQIMACRMLEAERSDNRLGTCGMGVGQAVGDSRFGDAVTARDILAGKPGLEKLKRLYRLKQMEVQPVLTRCREPNSPLFKMYGELLARCVDVEGLFETYRDILGRVRVDRTGTDMCRSLDKGGVVFEGAQGALLDRQFGFTPFVTKTRTTCHNALDIMDEVRRSGFARHRRLEHVIGVARAYATRHGPGPFVTEEPLLAEQFRDEGNPENRWQGPFRVGWLDLVALRYGVRLNEHIDGLALTCLDQLSGLDTVRACTAYEYEGDLDQLDRYFEWERIGRNRASIKAIKKGDGDEPEGELAGILSACRPSSWVELTGWNEDIRRARCQKDLPPAARDYIELIQDYLNIPIWIVSVGPTAADKFFLF